MANAKFTMYFFVCFFCFFCIKNANRNSLHNASVTVLYTEVKPKKEGKRKIGVEYGESGGGMWGGWEGPKTDNPLKKKKNTTHPCHPPAVVFILQKKLPHTKRTSLRPINFSNNTFFGSYSHLAIF